MRLLRVQICNLFGIDKGVVTVPSSNIATLVGANGAGKSSVLKAVDYFLRHQALGESRVTLEGGLKVNPKDESSIRLDFELNDTETETFRKWRFLGCMTSLIENQFVQDKLSELGYYDDAEKLRDFWFRAVQRSEDDTSSTKGTLEDMMDLGFKRVHWSAVTKRTNPMVLEYGSPVFDHLNQSPGDALKQLEILLKRELKFEEKNEHFKEILANFKVVLNQYMFIPFKRPHLSWITDAFEGLATEIENRWDVVKNEFQRGVGHLPHSISDNSDFKSVMKLLLFASVVILPQDRGLLTTLPSHRQRTKKSAAYLSRLTLRNAIQLAHSKFLSKERKDQEQVETFRQAYKDLFGKHFDVRPLAADPTYKEDEKSQGDGSMAIHRGNSVISIEDASGGELEGFLVLAALFLCNSQTVFLDEPGYSLHPPMQIKLRKLLLQLLDPKQVQAMPRSILIVTHSVELLCERSFYGIHHLRRSEQNVSVIKKLADDNSPRNASYHHQETLLSLQVNAIHACSLWRLPHKSCILKSLPLIVERLRTRRQSLLKTQCHGKRL
eukprot:m.99334 g.99334  ORF g.99334 m.99334 type:complete len:552 (+) comp37065_c0_seq1:678-2333(+)